MVIKTLEPTQPYEDKMTENHTIVINLENARIGCPYCDEWEPYFGTRYTDTQFLCDKLLKDHLRRLENEKFIIEDKE